METLDCAPTAVSGDERGCLPGNQLEPFMVSCWCLLDTGHRFKAPLSVGACLTQGTGSRPSRLYLELSPACCPPLGHERRDMCPHSARAWAAGGNDGLSRMAGRPTPLGSRRESPWTWGLEFRLLFYDGEMEAPRGPETDPQAHGRSVPEMTVGPRPPLSLPGHPGLRPADPLVIHEWALVGLVSS